VSGHPAQVAPGAIVIVALFVVVWLAAVAVVVDALRRPASDFADLPEGRLTYAIVEGLFAVLVALWQAPAVSRAFASVPWMVPGALVAIVFEFAYLLRVVFPSPKRLAARDRRGKDGDDTD
jgi:hypothetical protein